MKKIFDKNIPRKNYIIVFIVSILVVLVSIYIRKIYLNNKDHLLDKSIFESEKSMVSQIKYEDLDFVVSESTNVVLLVSYNGSNEIKNTERKLYREIVKNDLTSKIIYLNITDYLENNKYISMLKEKFPNVSSEISTAPIMIYIKDGEAIEAVNSEFHLIDNDVLNKLLLKYENQ